MDTNRTASISDPCRAGTKRSFDDTVCVPCVGQTISSEGASRCIACSEKQFSNDGNTKCGKSLSYSINWLSNFIPIP